MVLKSAEEAKKQSESFDLSAQQIIDKVAQLIDGNSKAGMRSITVQYLKSAVSQEELNSAMGTIQEKGYTTEMIHNPGASDKYSIKINW